MQGELEKYFLGELSEEEKKTLFDKIKSNEDYKSEFIRLQNTMSLSKLYTQKQDPELSRLLMEQLFRNIHAKQIRHIFRKTLRYAAIILLLMINGALVWMQVSEIKKEPGYTLVEVPKGQRVSTTLTDGVEVWVGSRSLLCIPDKSGKKECIVKLDGEGYFSVPKDIQKTFIVETGPYQIKVTGTSFHVFSYSASTRFETELLSGKIEITHRDHPEETIYMEPGERVTLKEGKLIKSISGLHNEEDLKNGLFSFTNKPFGEILENLSLWFDVRFVVKNPAQKDLQISGKFRRNDDIQNILKALQGVHPFRFEETEDQQEIEIF
ncbi:MAG: DUF4974 domain-containing protein [Tannerellaceae bacterium]|nr:DUF4974 domain-containing protein [Tannerellaceae bacterium]